jgi:hypothetical protein
MGTNFPVELTRFIGRAQEIGDFTRVLADARRLTLTGPGDHGKMQRSHEARQVL